MSVAGILAGTLFSGALPQLAQKAPQSTSGSSSAPLAFTSLQQMLSQSSSVAAPGTTPISSELMQLGQDLKSGNLSEAQVDYSALSTSIAHHHISGQPRPGAGASGNNSQAVASEMAGSSGAISNFLSAAMLAYSSLQQSPNTGKLGSSLITPASTFSINA